MKKYVLFVLALIVILAIAVFAFNQRDNAQDASSQRRSEDVGPYTGNDEQSREAASGGEEAQKSDSLNSWRSIQLIDVKTQEIFSIDSLLEQGKPILIESFAVLCSVCDEQQSYIMELHNEPGYSKGELISISLNTDPNEDEAKVLEHVNDKGFDWLYAVAPIEMTQSLIDEFGVSIINAPSAPIIIICPDKTAFKVTQNGAKDVSELKEQLAKCGA